MKSKKKAAKKPAKKTPARKKVAARKATARKSVVKKTAAKKVAARKARKKTTARKAVVRKSAAKKVVKKAVKKTTVKKAPARKGRARKPAAKKAAPKRAAAGLPAGATFELAGAGAPLGGDAARADITTRVIQIVANTGGRLVATVRAAYEANNGSDTWFRVGVAPATVGGMRLAFSNVSHGIYGGERVGSDDMDGIDTVRAAILLTIAKAGV
ncbi:MAG: histone H1-like repetitive region-containing protein [Solimonas sp.]